MVKFANKWGSVSNVLWWFPSGVVVSNPLDKVSRLSTVKFGVDDGFDRKLGFAFYNRRVRRRLDLSW